MEEKQIEHSDEAKLKGREGLLLKLLFSLTIFGIPLASVILMYWAVNQ
jgi:hypothetical protein